MTKFSEQMPEEFVSLMVVYYRDEAFDAFQGMYTSGSLYKTTYSGVSDVTYVWDLMNSNLFEHLWWCNLEDVVSKLPFKSIDKGEFPKPGQDLFCRDTSYGSEKFFKAKTDSDNNFYGSHGNVLMLGVNFPNNCGGLEWVLFDTLREALRILNINIKKEKEQ